MNSFYNVDNFKDYASIEEVAATLRVSKATLERKCHKGSIPAKKVGWNWIISRIYLYPLLKNPLDP